MAAVTYSWSRLAMARAHYKLMEQNALQQLSKARLQLMILQVLEEEGGQMVALELAEEVLKRLGNKDITTFDFCSAIKRKPDELVLLG